MDNYVILITKNGLVPKNFYSSVILFVCFEKNFADGPASTPNLSHNLGFGNRWTTFNQKWRYFSFLEVKDLLH